MSKGEKFFSPCATCKRDTRHQVLEEVSEIDSEDYHYARYFSIIQCLGCEQKSFRDKFVDYEQAYPISDTEWQALEETKYFPKFNSQHVVLDRLYVLPEIVGDIYKETISAVQEGALTLAGLGLRGTIEAVCNDQNITGRTLESRISKMASQGLISNRDADRLHAIRFLGNDAAHEIKKPTDEQTSVALKIVNHLIQSVYLLEKEMKRNLDSIITEGEEFITLLNEKLKTFSKNDEFPIAKFLGKDIRRLGSGASALESYLETEISAGRYKKLTVGKKAKFAGSKGDVQHFVVS